MTLALRGWLRETARVYVGNACVTRDFRTQLRGNRALWLWGGYLLVLMAFALTVYAQTVERPGLTVADAQQRLQEFYQIMMGGLTVLISIIVPAFAATTVVAERQRRSLDLVFSAPVSPKYYLVGKLISSYRYVWMLLALALPVTASCVVLGGATWIDVLEGYAALSLFALICTAIALLFSTICQKVVSAVIWSYIAVIAYAGVATWVGGSLAARSVWVDSGNGDVSFTAVLSPFYAAFAAGTHSTVFGVQVPNLVIAVLISLFLTRLLLLGAASALAPSPTRDTVALRLQMLVGLGLITFLGGWMSGFGYGLDSYDDRISDRIALNWPNLCAWLGIFVVAVSLLSPFFTCYGADEDGKFRYDGTVSLRGILRGTPSGGLPYLLLLVAVGLMGAALGGWVISSSRPSIRLYDEAAWAAGVVLFSWGVGRLTSAILPTLRSARLVAFAGHLVFWFVPLPFMVAFNDPDAAGSNLNRYPLSPIRFDASGANTLTWAAIMAGLGLGLYLISGACVARRQRLSEAGAG